MLREGRLCALGGAVVTVEADVDQVERRSAAGVLGLAIAGYKCSVA
ncbi:hypothetical protein I552_6591 [Mycobacterium xenopi 3993]|nr:hypothetical protein I552_6591 [Mycobacterium xenopi 3993]